MKNKKRFFLIPVILLLLAGIAVQHHMKTPSFCPETAVYSYDLPGLDREYKILLVTDLHIIADGDPSISNSQKETVSLRHLSFANDYGKSAEYWKKLAPVLDSYKADMILFGGDMVDYCSEENIRLLQEGLSQIKTPFLYIRADHDNAVWFSDTLTEQEASVIQGTLGNTDNVISEDLGKLRIVGWNNSTSPMTAEGLSALLFQLEEAKEQNDRVIFLTHVPLDSPIDNTLAEMSKKAWNDRALIWGNNCYYVPDQTTSEALQAVLAPDSPVSMVLSGHLHFEYTGNLTETIVQYTADPAYEGGIAMFTFY